MALEGTNHLINLGTTIKYNMTLEYHMENPLGAKVYVDPLGRYAIKVDDYGIEFQREIRASFQGDRYMDPYATMYILIDDLVSTNKWGIKEID